MTYILIAIAVILVLAFLGKVTNKPVVIAAPTLGVLDLTNGVDASIATDDAKTLSDLFSGVTMSTDQPPICTVLLLYCRIGSDGNIAGSGLGLREIIRDSQAPIVVVASENTGDAYMATAKERKPYGQANLVLTISRRERSLIQFLYRLFSQMKRGVSMPVAWVELAPQHSEAPEHKHLPETIFGCERGQIAFQ
jgi:hypothetical protein